MIAHTEEFLVLKFLCHNILEKIFSPEKILAQFLLNKHRSYEFRDDCLLCTYSMVTYSVVNDNCPETDGIFKFKNE